MFVNRVHFLWMLPLLAMILCVGSSPLWAQDEQESPEAKQYREDYERLQKTTAISDAVKRADGLLAFLKERPDSKMADYAQGNYLQVLEGLAKAEKYQVVVTLCERFIKLRPRVGEAYYFYGAALKNTGKVPEAMDALAKCAVMKNNNAARKAREFLEYIYKSQNQGSIVGLDKLLKKAQDDLSK
jgi:tetratricopeptide (TPR) repeat protein